MMILFINNVAIHLNKASVAIISKCLWLLRRQLQECVEGKAAAAGA